MVSHSSQGWWGILNPVVQLLLFVVVVGGLLWLGVQLYSAVVG